MRINQTAPCSGESLDTVVNNAISKLIGVPGKAPIQEFIAALQRAVPREGAVLLSARELPFTQRILAENTAAQVSTLIGAVRSLRPNACCTKPLEAVKTIDALAGALQEVVSSLQAGLPVDSPVIVNKLNLVDSDGCFSLLGRLEKLYGLDQAAESPGDEERLAEFCNIRSLVGKLRADLTPPTKPGPTSDLVPEIRSKGNALACQLDNAVEALDADVKLECRWRQEQAGDIELGNLVEWTRTYVTEEVPNLVSGFGREVSPAVGATLREQADRWAKVPDEELKKLSGSAQISAALLKLADAIHPRQAKHEEAAV